MTENLHIIAIQEAVKANPSDPIRTARDILNFLLAAETLKAETPAAETLKAETPAAETLKAEAPRRGRPPKAAVKAEAPKAEAPKAEAPKAEAPKAEVVDKARVVSAIANLLKSNMRDEAVAIMANYGAKSISDLSPTDYAAVIQDAMDASV